MSLTVILNPQPPTVGEFSKFWITRLSIFFGQRNRFSGSISPMDERGNLLSLQTPFNATIASLTEQQGDQLAQLTTALRAHANSTAPVFDAHVIAPSPLQPVRLQYRLVGDPPHSRVIADCTALVTASPDVFAPAWNAVVSMVASITGKPVSQS